MTLRLLVVGLVALLGSAAGAGATGVSAPSPGAFGIIPIRSAAGVKLNPTEPVVYHGGPVMHNLTVHTIFWAPAGHHFSGSPTPGVAGYEPLLQRFLSDVAGDSGKPGNIFSVLSEYPDRSGAGSNLRYNPSVDSVDAVDPYPARSSGCASPAGIAVCLTDAQVRREILRVRRRAHVPAGLGQLWLVFLPPAVDECTGAGSCASNTYAGYHSLTSSGGLTVYSPIPDPTVESTAPPGSDPQGNPAAESAINTVAHEMVEAITDPTGTGWMSPNGAEIGDKCELGPQYGSPLGFAPDGSPYNQLIGGHEYLLQGVWSAGVSGCVSRPGVRPKNVVLPEVYLRQFSARISGRIGVARAGISVRLLLARAGEPVAVAVGRTRADGAWGPAVLRGLADGRPRGVGDDRDVLLVAYGRGGPPEEAIVTGNGGNPFTGAGFTGWYELDHGYRIRSDRRHGQVEVAPCSQTGQISLRVGTRAPLSATDACATDSGEAVLGTPALRSGATIGLASFDNRGSMPLDRPGVLVRLEIRAGEPNSVSADSGAPTPFSPTGFPTCTADLQLRRVSCQGLVPGRVYRLGRRRPAGGVTLARADGDGRLPAVKLTGRRPLAGGDEVLLRNEAGRTLTDLHVARLRVDVQGHETALSGGSCQPGLFYGAPLTAPPLSRSTFRLGAAGTGTACPLSGSASGLPVSQIEQVDDQSGGLTRTEVPNIEDTAPLQDETVGPRFTLLAGAGLPGPHGSVLASAARVAVTVTSVGGGPAVARVGNVNTGRGVTLGPLPSGVYLATWTLHDAAGDTRTLHTRFIVAGQSFGLP